LIRLNVFITVDFIPKTAYTVPGLKPFVENQMNCPKMGLNAKKIDEKPHASLKKGYMGYL